MHMDIPLKNPPDECSSCYHWDAMSDSNFGNCVEICKSVSPDQACNYEMMSTDRHFCCIFYKRVKRYEASL